MKRIILPLTLLIIVLGLYVGYKALATKPITDVEMEMLVESAGSTQYLTSMQRTDNERLFSNIKSLVENNQNRKRDLKVLETVGEIKLMTDVILEKSSKIRVDAIKSVGSTVEKITNRDRKVGIDEKAIYELIFLVKSYSDTLNIIAEKDLSSILISPEKEDLESFKYFNYYFKDKSLAIFLLNLSRMENDIVNLEREAVETVGQVANYVDVAFDSLVPLIDVANKVVKNGDLYQAEITFGALDPEAKQLMSVDNIAVQSENGFGKLLLSPSKFKSRRGEQSIRGAVTLYTPFGSTTYGVAHSFEVKKN